MSKLHPVYAALDNHQYSRAIKLASALPDSNVLGKALLAHAYYKSGQRYLALVTLYKILGEVARGDVDSNNINIYFCELKQEIEYALEAVEERKQLASLSNNNKQSATSSVPEAISNSISKKGKKGKKNKVTVATPKQTSPATKLDADESSFLDLLDQLNTQPTLPENWDALPAPANAITDETILGTMSVTLNGLKLVLTAYQLYAWATTSEKATDEILQKTFCLGLNVLAAPSKWTVECRQQIEVHVLSNIQTVALQWARLYVHQPGGLSTFNPMLATAWAAQAALWQLQWLPEDPKRSTILPRLAESMAQRLLQQEEESKFQSAEVQMLALRTLRQQSKLEEMLEILGKQLSSETGDEPPAVVTDFGVSMTVNQVMTKKAHVLCELERYEEAKALYEELIARSPDDWSFWKGHLHCCSKLENTLHTKDLVDGVLLKHSTKKYLMRGPHLMKVELEADKFRNSLDLSSLAALSSSIQVYSNIFASHAACAFSDLEAYIELVLSKDVDGSSQIVEDLLRFAQNLRTSNASAQDGGERYCLKERLSRLRAFIFAVKVNHKILVVRENLQGQWLPEWEDLITEWKSTLMMNSSTEGEESQKEVKPGDDLVLLAVQQLLYKNPGNVEYQVLCAALLEKAMEHSPDNAYLKISVIHIYYELNALSRSWECYQAMGVKHIQLDTCTFTILPYLLKGGLYNEAIEVCNALLRFQVKTASDCGDYAGRAMENGTMGKADEFLVFQRVKMNKSLSTLNAKGVILDCAAVLATAVPRTKLNEDPIFRGGLGVFQGIVGGDDDMMRATQMIVEAHNPSAALSLVSWADHCGSANSCCSDMADNRDLSIHCLQILLRITPPTKEEIRRDALRRGHIHGMLIRATLCLDAAKGPKKGKVVQSSEQLKKRANSLLDSVAAFNVFLEDHSIQDGAEDVCCKAILETTIELCRVLVVISAGLPSVGPDSLEQREQSACDLLTTKVLPKLQQAAALPAFSVKMVCSLLPSCMVPIYAVFRMCANICELYGWGKRKHKTKQCAKALQEVAIEFKGLITNNMLPSVARLPATGECSGETISFERQEDFGGCLTDENVILTLNGVTRAQYVTRQRVEPILREMHDYLDTFNVNEDSATNLG